jgi:hypothetical protein
VGFENSVALSDSPNLQPDRVNEPYGALRERRLSIATLLAVAVLGAIALGRYEEAAILVVVYSQAGILEEYVTGRARSSLRALMALVPPLASRRRGDRLETVPVEELLPGEIVVVRPGERPGAGNQAKAIFRTTDGGRSWQPRARASLPPSSHNHGGIAGYGYPQGIAFAPDGLDSSGRAAASGRISPRWTA